VSVHWARRQGPGSFAILAELAPQAKPQLVEEKILSTLEAIRLRGLSEDELERARKALTLNTFDQLGSALGRANTLATAEALVGGWEAAFDKLDDYARCRPAEVRDAARRYWEPQTRCTAMMLP
jgi:predicted Zn-dependent peptidase